VLLLVQFVGRKRLEIPVGDHQALGARNLRLPAEQLLRQRDIRLALHGIILRQRLVDDLLRGARELDDLPGELLDGDLRGGADINGTGVPGDGAVP